MKEIKFLDQGVAIFHPTGFQRLIETAATLAVKSTAQSALEYLPLYAAEPQFRYATGAVAQIGQKCSEVVEGAVRSMWAFSGAILVADMSWSNRFARDDLRYPETEHTNGRECYKGCDK